MSGIPSFPVFGLRSISIPLPSAFGNLPPPLTHATLFLINTTGLLIIIRCKGWRNCEPTITPSRVGLDAVQASQIRSELEGSRARIERDTVTPSALRIMTVETARFDRPRLAGVNCVLFQQLLDRFHRQRAVRLFQHNSGDCEAP